VYEEQNEFGAGDPVWGTGNQGAAAPWRGAGCPRKTSFSFFARRRRRRAKKENIGAQPHSLSPRQGPSVEGRPPFTIPLMLTPKGVSPSLQV